MCRFLQNNSAREIWGIDYGITDALALIQECRWTEAEAKLMHIQQQAEAAYVDVPGEIYKLHQNKE